MPDYDVHALANHCEMLSLLKPGASVSKKFSVNRSRNVVARRVDVDQHDIIQLTADRKCLDSWSLFPAAKMSAHDLTSKSKFHDPKVEAELFT